MAVGGVTARRRGGLEAVRRRDDAYPASLNDLSDPPAILYVAGGGPDRLAALAAGPVATVVGGRRASPYAIEVAEALGRDLAAAGVAVVSGLALGVDAAAHRGATGAGGPAIAVLGSGADVPYPRANAALYRRVLDAGVVLSETPPGTRPAPWTFPARNRIMAAFGRFVVVVEAAEPSGSLITARLAMDLGRDVGAVPGRVTSAAAAGSNGLLLDGASVVRSAEDVLDALFGVGLDADGRPRSGGTRQRAREEGSPAAGLDPPVRRVLEAVEDGRRIEAIGPELGLPPGEVRAALGRLELLGLVRRDGLGLYERVAGP